MSVLDPYRPENYEAEVSRLSKAKNNHGGAGDAFGVFVIFTVAAVVLGVILGLGSMAFGVDSPWILARNIIGAIYALANLGIVGVLIKEGRERRQLHRLEAMKPAVSHPMPATHDLKRLAQALRSLPLERRSELRPLWDAALEASELLRVDPENKDARARLNKRANAAEDVLKAERELAAAQRQEEEDAKRNAVISRYSSTDDSDLELADFYATALRAGVTRYKEMTS